MTITYILENKDVDHLLKNASKIYPALKRSKYFRTFLMILLSIYLTSRLELETFGLKIFGFSLVITLYYVIVKILTWIGHRLITVKSKNPLYNTALLGNHTLTISEDGLTESTDINETKEKWQGILNIINTTEYIYLLSASSNTYIIPKRIFASENEANYFYQAAVDYHSKTKLTG